MGGVLTVTGASNKTTKYCTLIRYYPGASAVALGTQEGSDELEF